MRQSITLYYVLVVRKTKTALIPLAAALAATLTITGCAGADTAGGHDGGARDGADISISAAGPVDVRDADGTVTFHLEVANLGPGTTSTVDDVFIGAQVPAGVELVASTGPDDAQQMPAVAGQTAILWPRTVVDDLEPGDTVDLTATVSVPAAQADFQTTWAVTGGGGTGLDGDPVLESNAAWVTLAANGSRRDGPAAGPAVASAGEARSSSGTWRWSHRVVTWRLRSPAWTWSAAGQRQSIALAMAAWDRASSRLTLRQTRGPADIEISYEALDHYRGNPDVSFGWNDAGHGFYPGNYRLAGDIHINGRFPWGPMGTWAPLRFAGIHEIGHALGLPHAPANYCQGWGAAVPVMCSTWPHPTAPTAYDVWALQRLYGA